MRLERMSVAGFRGFAKEVEFAIDADVVLLSGPNGTGKTSFFDAILWGLTGSIERIGSDETVINQFAEFGDARVEIDLKTRDGSALRIIRRFSDIMTLTVAFDGNEPVAGDAAQALLLSKLYPDRSALDDSPEAFTRWLTHFGYLEQDRVNAFVEASDDQERFRVVGELVGASRLNRLNLELEKSRKAWTTDTNQRRDTISSLRKNRNDLQDRLDRIDNSINWEQLVQECIDWSSGANSLAKRSQVRSPIESADPAAWASVVDGTVRRVSAELRALEVLSNDITRMRRTLAAIPKSTEDPSRVLAALEVIEKRVAGAASQLQEAEEAISKARRQRLAEAEMSRSLASMAQLALKHLGEACPVCDQSYDVRATTKRLRALTERAELPVEDLDDLYLRNTADNLRNLEIQLTEQRAQLRASESTSRRLDELRSQVESSAQRLELSLPRDDQNLSASLDVLASEVDVRTGRLRALRDDGERISALLARAIEAAEAGSLSRRIAELNDTISEQEDECALRDEAAEDAQQMHEAVRDLAKSLVEEELQRIEPLLQRIYSTIDPHPAFKVVRFLTGRWRGRGQLWTAMEAATNDRPIVVKEPSTVLSSSQLNVLAVATFLSLNLSIDNPPLDIMALDDPLQSLDSVNLLGLADLLRRLRGRRQVFVSTHDNRLADLLERKLRPIGERERTIAVSLDAWDRLGPVVTLRALKRDTRGLRLVAA